MAGEGSGGGVAGEGADWNMVAQLVIFTLSNQMSGVIHVHHSHSYINAQLTVTWPSLPPLVPLSFEYHPSFPHQTILHALFLLLTPHLTLHSPNSPLILPHHPSPAAQPECSPCH